MNEVVQNQLKVIIERAVRPVQAPVAWKRKTREELLAHVTGVFEDERTRTEDDQLALIQAEKRFGDPIEITRTLQSSVSSKDHFAFYIEKTIARRPKLSPVRNAWRYAMMLFAFDAIFSIALCFIIFPLIGKLNQIGFATYILLVISIATGGLMFAAALLINGLEQALFRTSKPSYFRGGIIMILSCFLPVTAPMIVTLGMFPFVSDGLILDLPGLKGALPATLLIPAILIILAKAFSLERKYVEEWAKLEID